MAGAVALAVAAPAGAGGDATESRQASGFEKVQFNGYFNGDITAGTRETSVTLSGDPAVLALITVSVEGKTLVGTKPGSNNIRSATHVAGSLPVLRGFEISAPEGRKSSA